jgi:hypothetical protein
LLTKVYARLDFAVRGSGLARAIEAHGANSSRFSGTLIFSDSKAGLSVVAEKANFSASVRSLDGPYTLAGGDFAL